ncbi:MAG: enoyl-CoA hydratase/isomerase family protein [Phaeodactylibacter sp.]|nr:enoyl-CoA hydratase/isomerase family protein [Phaeodactylibacter sp.]MCB9298324.1 enoyl-CoA hydratase/isomerase family protein [Lewinellaceae bacterium]
MGQVVRLQELGNDMVQVTMEDRAARNTFSEDLIKGIVAAFAHIKNTPSYKVVILTGYENYFCCGGTKEELFRIYKGEISFNDLGFFRLPLECEVPVISAMQGHGIGGGFIFGLYADFTILGRENIYTTNFMKYGFTPGMGGTLMAPLRLGATLGNEMLFSAENYRGGELKERGVPLKVVPKAEVLKEAIGLAKQLAEKPRLSLATLKAHLTAGIKAKLPAIIEEELKMHAITFHQPEVAERIEALFGN